MKRNASVRGRRRKRRAIGAESGLATPGKKRRRRPSEAAVRAASRGESRSQALDGAAAELRAVNQQQAHNGLAKLHADLLELERSSKTADDVFREAGTWDGDAETLEVELRAARDAGGSKPPVSFRD